MSMLDPTSARTRTQGHVARNAARDARDFEVRSDAVLVIGPDARLRYLGPQAEELFGAPAASVLGLPIHEALGQLRHRARSGPPFEQALADAMRTGSRTTVPLALVTPERGSLQLEGRIYGPRQDTGNLILVFHDVTGAHAELTVVRESEQRFHLIAEASRDMVTETSASGHFTYVSPACSRVLGYTDAELLEQGPLAILHDDDRSPFRRAVNERKQPGVPFTVGAHRLRCKDGRWIWVEATGVYHQRPDGEIRLIGVARDITARVEAETARHQLEERLRRAQKLESLGILTGGIAHDFNNYLTPIVGTAGLLGMELPADSPLQRRVEMIRKAARRATDLTAQMLAYAGRSEPRLEPVDVSATIVDLQLLLESATTPVTTLEYELAPRLPCVRADDGQIGQVVMNLVANAREAIEDDDGRIEIATGMLEADTDLLLDYHLGDKREAGTYVYIDVRDNGVGIDDTTREHIFDPFFSTKFTGRGLGLAVVLGIVKSHRGALRIVSPPQGGTCFRVLLPAVHESTEAAIVEAPRLQPRGARDTERGLLLVVDDDEGARELTSLLLERDGFAVWATGDGGQAVEHFRQHSGEISAMILDHTMPGLSGSDVLAAVREIVPEVPIVLASGYSRERISNELLAHGATRFLRKPFDAEQLLETVHQLLDAERSATR